MLEKPKRKRSPKTMQAVRSEPCVICGKKGEAAHIRSKGSGGDDTMENLLSLCRKHHSEQHQSGWFAFAMRYVGVVYLLEDKGWVFEMTAPVMKLVRK